MIAISNHLRRAMLRMALSIAYWVRRSDGLTAQDFRNETPRTRPLSLIWAMGVDMSDPVNRARIETFRTGGETVVIVDTLSFSEVIALDCYVEMLPTPESREMAPMLDWHSYAKRRISRIRAAWNADLEFSLGQSPDAYLDCLAPSNMQDPSHRLAESTLQGEAALHDPPG